MKILFNHYEKFKTFRCGDILTLAACLGEKLLLTSAVVVVCVCAHACVHVQMHLYCQVDTVIQYKHTNHSR